MLFGRKKIQAPTPSESTAIFQQDFVYTIDSIAQRPQAHAANIIEGPIESGMQKLYCAWFCGTREGNEDVAILFSEISYPSKEQWDAKSNLKMEYSTPRVIADIPGFALGNPVLFLDPHQRMHLWFAKFVRSEGNKREIMHQFSDDLGKSWSPPTLFSDRGGLWVKNAVQILQDGTWLLPMNDEATTVKPYGTRWSSRFAYSEDEGKSWSFTDIYTLRKGIIQPSVIEFPDGHLLAYNRSRCGKIVEMKSLDHGRTWSTPTKTSLPNNNSNTSLLRLQNGDLLLCYNPVKKGRSPISIGRSKDNGKTWAILFHLQEEKGKEFSYPCLIQTKDGLCHAAYTFKRRTISHDVFLLK